MISKPVIIDPSWPLGPSVNLGVSSDRYLDTDFVLTYPSIDNITDQVLRLGKGFKIFKCNISGDFSSCTNRSKGSGSLRTQLEGVLYRFFCCHLGSNTVQ